jgi:hypothetical protein
MTAPTPSAEAVEAAISEWQPLGGPLVDQIERMLARAYAIDMPNHQDDT